MLAVRVTILLSRRSSVEILEAKALSEYARFLRFLMRLKNTITRNDRSECSSQQPYGILLRECNYSVVYEVYYQVMEYGCLAHAVEIWVDSPALDILELPLTGFCKNCRKDGP